MTYDSNHSYYNFYNKNISIGYHLMIIIPMIFHNLLYTNSFYHIHLHLTYKNCSYHYSNPCNKFFQFHHLHLLNIKQIYLIVYYLHIIIS